MTKYYPEIVLIGKNFSPINLLIGTLQNGATFFSSDIQEICKMFTEFSITFYKYDEDTEYMEE